MNILFFFLAVSLLQSFLYCQVPETTPFPLALTSFTCQGRLPGYYADLETGCKTYHVCDGNGHFTYLCPRGTLFRQRNRICDHSYLVRCEDSLHFFEVEDAYPSDEEEILFHYADTEESLLDRGNVEDDYNQTEVFLPTEPTQLTTLELPEISVTSAPSTGDLTPVTTSQKTLEEPTNSDSKENNPGQPTQNFLKFLLKDFRSLFFIPEFDNNSVIAKPERELILPVEKNVLMKFKSRKTTLFSSCPTYCNPKFFLLGTCHPCIMIK